jgi:uncharacterized membrane protein
MIDDPYKVLEWLHIVSSAVLFGAGIGTAFHMWMAHRRDPRVVAAVARNAVLAGWLFTVPAGIVQPVTGFSMVYVAGYDPFDSWLVGAYALYLLAFACWVPAVRLQMRIRALATEAAARDAPLPSACDQAMRVWSVLSWTAFAGLIVIFWLMIAKPALW